ncbi:ankyrin repeat-containing protein At5g02620-like [Macadamia integrifolia]|uniref:ankyrin repeat-containing protein At5g02620-like n=1 Tax=Macadamia integrifolia TaxID=60698 RepID=UPI001C4F25FE|nr:ankyrin repeat-containing protein At5g02620-like [Macadamia integrifolia]
MDPQVYRAAKLGDITLLQQVVIEDSSRLLRVTPNENTALHVSVSFGHIEFVNEVYSALLRHNSNLEGNMEYNRSLSLITQVNSEDDTALHVAAREGHASIAKFLIEKIKPWSSSHDVESGNYSSVVLEKLRMRNKSFHTALHEAVSRNDFEMVKLLTETDPDLGHPNYDADHAEGCGESPLYLAASDGCLDILNQIFLICPSPAHGGPHGRTALHVAVVERRLSVVKVLLEKMGKILVDKVDKNERTALHYAVSDGSFQITQRLLQRRGKSSGDLNIVQQLLRHDTSNAYKLDKDGLSPLHITALESSIQVFRELLKCCPDSGELVDKKGRNVLHFAVMSKDFKKISFALRQVELEGLVNKTDDDGNTPFHLAATLGSFMLMRHFLSIRRVDVKATNNMGQTAAEIFQSTQEGNTASMLLYQLLMAHIFLPRHAINVRGENKWMIGGGGGANKEQICSDPLQNQAEGEKKAATTKVTKNQREMGKTLQIVASLIATVTFTAVFQVPGGYNTVSGKPLLIDNPDFKSFMILDIHALSLSLISLIVMFLPPLVGDHFYSSFLEMGTTLICYAIVFTFVAFLKGMRAVLSNFDVVSALTSLTSALTSLIVSLVYILFLANIVATLFLLRRHSRIGP